MTQRSFALASAAVAILGGAACSPSLLINETASLPRGVYLRTKEPIAHGAIVALRPPPEARAYLAELGAPPQARLLKRVVATRGEVVCRNGRLVTWPRGVVTALPRDRLGRPLFEWRGCRRLADDQIVVLGDTALSFDSRYFGPVREAAVDGVYREVWRW